MMNISIVGKMPQFRQKFAINSFYHKKNILSTLLTNEKTEIEINQFFRFSKYLQDDLYNHCHAISAIVFHLILNIRLFFVIDT